MSNQPCGQCHRGLTANSEVCGECEGTAIRREKTETVVQQVKRVVKKAISKKKK